MLDWEGGKTCMQISLDVQHCMSATSISCVCLYGSHCIVMLAVHTWRAALVSTSVCHECRLLLAAQAFWSQSIAVLTSIFILSWMTASSCAHGMNASKLPPATSHLLKKTCKTACILAAKSLASMHTSCAALVWLANSARAAALRGSRYDR